MFDREQAWRDAMRHHAVGMDELKKSLLAEYRCRKGGCLLLRVWNSPNGPEFYAPAARVSDRFATAGQLDWPAFNRHSPERTGDRAGRLDDPVIATQWLWLVCDHLKEAVWTSELRADIKGRRPGDPTRVRLPRGHADTT
ncbi:MAG: hypothetical protein QG671_1951 [Actinomycetota bacterium]|nr:hypothetical protein [Actinomycetota bacterium]